MSRIASGKYRSKLLKDGHPSQPKAKEPFCTRSQIIVYFDDNGRRIAIVHQYLRTDGSLGASGKPDPYKLFHNGVLYIAKG
jgi:hypothetical protein